MQPPRPEDVARVTAVKDAAQAALLAIPGVHSVGVGRRYRAGEPVDELAIVVFLEKKRPRAEVPPAELVPPEIDGVPTDVEESEPPVTFQDIARYRPLRGGARVEVTIRSMGPTGGTIRTLGGTLGCMARARAMGNKVVFLTNQHVVFGCASLATTPGDAVGQPDTTADHTCCSKTWATVVGRVLRAVATPAVDAAVVELDKCVDWLPEVIGIGTVEGSLSGAQIDAMLDQPVQKRGSATMLTHGTVRAVNIGGTITCTDTDGVSSPRAYARALRVEHHPSEGAFARPGDSGSAVLDNSRRVVGLLFGGNMAQMTGLVCRIDDVIAAFGSELDLQILTPALATESASAAAPAAAFSAELEPRSFATAPEAGADTFEPTREELALLLGARDELLATPAGQRLARRVAGHVEEVRALVRTRARVAAVWRRVAAPQLLRGAVGALRHPERPLADFAEGPPLAERLGRFGRVLTRYGSEALRADLARYAPLLLPLAAGSYADLRAWLQAAPQDL